ncbi:helix-turn-helix domain-containing protein [Bacillus cytotoxicus]|nr:helix-turn-helix domain-containing protein [Bacillus cytotoxicus]AWC30852.1 DNA-binding protein [Bacillus cytotoxicus]AWC42989.1 DNA-binding protein [Bacillus cytotoxicus]AWC50920.1 DNA-binding protein [Bacillus cytotoxicus]AWC54978.1 DNA-binding protein [Bacillus cytotoxicus]AWC59100.1 DNA-binding protein [Bacillus cytotoxicus]
MDFSRIEGVNKMYKFANKNELLSFLQEEVLTTPEVMDVLGVSKSRISKMIKDGKLVPFKKMERVSLFLREDIEEKKKELEVLRVKYRPYDE